MRRVKIALTPDTVNGLCIGIEDEYTSILIDSVLGDLPPSPHANERSVNE